MLRTIGPLTAVVPRRGYGSGNSLKPVRSLPDASLQSFCDVAFVPETPAVFPRGTFDTLPAVNRWFTQSNDERNASTLNRAYLARFGSITVPLEISSNEQFTRVEQPLSFFLHVAMDTPPTNKIYLAQAPINDLPRALRDDLSAPEYVLKAGKGDIYDSSIWLGQAPTYTPLHRDPNPNLFVQLAGTKVVRLFKPNVGRGIFAKVQESIGANASATLRGEEMMQGAEKQALEHEVWRSSDMSSAVGFEAELSRGDGLFIPKGWWHSVKGIGDGMTGSVNWWFR
ncbi:hypothetical protein LTR62_002002 [Meristemomyces frigidus]|uniref:JmjC domain-containing protein n=1 Tax=Meristemomyces frigidus TaxID=1508187 RepID=A0AAN7TMM0_9PEZI|nr:hypothetical protein LTR62_002002 [Meristemomyces frigidus]